MATITLWRMQQTTAILTVTEKHRFTTVSQTPQTSLKNDESALMHQYLCQLLCFQYIIESF